jgi:hypothetical protein
MYTQRNKFGPAKIAEIEEIMGKIREECRPKGEEKNLVESIIKEGPVDPKPRENVVIEEE